MDQLNAFDSPTTSRLHQAEYLVGLGVSVALFIAHIGEVRWLPAIALFVSIDLIGYVPGAVAYRRSPTKRIHKGFYIAYNTMHSLITHAALIGVWIWASGAEWALLAIPIHLFADRGVFRNSMKPFGLPFEPVPDEDFARLTRQLFGPRAAVADPSAAPVRSAVGPTR
ncbi:hypothetical protein [Streptomyces alanosinicus]|uniref:Integral membrane protein n=1 Tax=Streptomyces alanosinicus TaxID=68171 RepID=A0A918YVP1_9ACTN|nr:hypothetical protein [Streptomyces alanosinicus]GHE15584.1 hypothetical protein GCM10010339_90700 [Streptomyces alanosinicus]